MITSPLSVRRFWILVFSIVSVFTIVFYQLFQLSVFLRPALTEVAERQHRLLIEEPPLRGPIVDRRGKELAVNLKVPSVYAVPRLLSKRHLESMVRRLSETLDLEPSFVRERLSRDKAFVWLKRKISFEEADDIRAMNSPVLGLVEESRRFYPQGKLFAHLLGFTDIDNLGLEGMELFLNRDLQGQPGSRITKRDALGREIRAFEIKANPPVNGHKVVLTLDQHIQYLTERALNRAYEKWKAKGAMAVVMEAKTGRIVAMTSRPTYDPNEYAGSLPEMRRNRVLTDMYEPGSVFKIVAASAALNEDKSSVLTTFDCESGSYRYGSKVLHDVHPYGVMTFEEVLVKSSNIGISKIAALLEHETLYEYIRAFGFAEPSGIDFPGEAPGFIRPPEKWSKTSPYNIPMGHEVMVTALQMATAMAVIANGGELMRPYLIDRVEDASGVTLRETEPLVRRRVLRPETAKIMKRILTRVVEEGTGKRAQIEGIPTGGKTGTAQKVLPDGRGYSHSNFISSFVGFAPADDPQFVMAVVLDDPHPLYYGGTVSAPVFKEVMEATLLASRYLPTATEMSMPVEDLPDNPPIFQPAEAMGKGF